MTDKCYDSEGYAGKFLQNPILTTPSSKEYQSAIIQNKKDEELAPSKYEILANNLVNDQWQQSKIAFIKFQEGTYSVNFQQTAFKCRENAIAITSLEEALLRLNQRTLTRKARGVEGTYQV